MLCAVGVICAAASHSFTIGVFTDSFTARCNVSRAVVSAIWTGRLIASSIYVNFIGRLVDRCSAPRIIRAAAIPLPLIP